MKILLISLTLLFSSTEGKEYQSLSAINENNPSAIKIIYLTRSGWLAETKNHLLLLDYVSYDGKNFDDFVQ